MAASSAEAPAFAFAFPARRFACDRCHRYKLRCERGPLITTLGVAAPLGPCKRCEKARVECTSSNAAMSRSSKRTIHQSPGPTIPNTSQDALNATSSSIDTSNELGSFSLDSAPADPSIFLDNFDFGLDIDGKDDINRYILPTNDTGTVKQSQFGGSEYAGDNGLAISEMFYTPPAESLNWRSRNPPPSTIDIAEQADSADQFMVTLEKLNKLQGFIFSEFGSIPKDNLLATFLVEGNGAWHTIGHDAADSNLVGKLLYASQQLIDILTSCGRSEIQLPSISSPLHPEDKSLNKRKRSDANPPDGNDQVRADIVNPSSLRASSSAAKAAATHSHWTKQSSNVNGGPSPLKTKTKSKLDPPIYPGLLSPAKLILMVCYVALLGVYRSILTGVFDMLRTLHPPAPSRAPAASPSKPPINTTTILSFRIQLEMLTHT